MRVPQWLFISTLVCLLPAPLSRAITPEKVECKRLANLNLSRSGHILMVSDDKVWAIGGHTTGFLPTATAECFNGTSWSLEDTYYTHDHGFAAMLPDGKVLIGGGSEQAFGIGQSWGVEQLNPRTCSFEAVGILANKQSYSSAACLPDGKVVVGGNWYAEDGLSVYIPGKGFGETIPVSVQRSAPLIFVKADGTPYAVGSYDIHGNVMESTVADCLDGSSFEVPLMKDYILPFQNQRIAPSPVGEHLWFIPATSKDDGHVVVLKVDGEHFSLVSLSEQIPMTGIHGTDISWHDQFLVRKSSRQAYLPGMDTEGRFYLLNMKYDAVLDGGSASLELLYTDSAAPGLSVSKYCMLPDGNIIIAGGNMPDNFSPTNQVWLIRLAPVQKTWLHLSWLLVLLLLLPAAYWIKKSKWDVSHLPSSTPIVRTDLMSGIVQLMEEEQLFRQQDLRLSDLASRLGTNTTYISATLSGNGSESFAHLVNGYRIRYAQQLMRDKPDKRLAEVAEESGFSNERSFFRSFKTATGMTPSEWKRAE